MIEILIVIGIVVMAVLLSGCKKPTEPEPEITEIKLAIPYERVGGKDWCLPASATMIFKYYGENISQVKIASGIIINGNPSTFRLVSYAKELGYFAEWKRKSIKEIEEYLRRGIPLIVIQKHGLTIPNSHSRVIIGFDSIKGELTLHDSVGKNNYKISYEEFFNLGFDSSEESQVIIIRR